METWDDVAAGLREMRAAAGRPSYAELARRVGAVRARREGAAATTPHRMTVFDCFKDGRRRMDLGLLADLGVALGLRGRQAREWELACFAVQNQVEASRVVSVAEQLPQTPTFVGRAAELAGLAGDPRIRLLWGVAGIGKTQLALQAAQRRLQSGEAQRILVADLRGFDPDRAPADGEAMLDELLRTLTGAVTSRLVSPTQRRATLAEELRARQVVLLLDDAVDAAQVSAIVDPATDLDVIVTSRHRLPLPGAAELEVPELSAGESVELLTAIAGADRMADRDVAERLVSQLAGLPLALDVLGHRIVGSDWELSDHEHLLRRQAELLQLPDRLGALLDASYARLSPAAAALLRALAVQPCPTLGRAAVTALGRPSDQADEALAELARSSLVRAGADRVGFHDLVRRFAVAKAEQHDAHSSQRAALSRLATHFHEGLWAAVSALGPGSWPRVSPERFRPVETQLDPDQAREWLAAERESLLVLTDPGLGPEVEDLTRDVGMLLSNWVDSTGTSADAVIWLNRALDRAEELGDTRAAVEAGTILGAAMVRLADPEAGTVLSTALQRSDPDLDPHLRVNALTSMAVLEHAQGSAERTLQLTEEALELVRVHGLDRPVANLLGNIGAALSRLGDLEGAVDHHRQAYEAALAEDDQVMAAISRVNEATLLTDLGRIEEAVSAAREGQRLAAQEQARMVLGYAHSHLGQALAAAGDVEGAVLAHREGVTVSRSISDPFGTADCLASLAASLLAADRPEEAESAYAEAWEVGSAAGYTNAMGQAEEGLGRIARSRGDLTTARTRLTAALTIFDETGQGHDAGRVRRALADLDEE